MMRRSRRGKGAEFRAEVRLRGMVLRVRNRQRARSNNEVLQAEQTDKKRVKVDVEYV